MSIIGYVTIKVPVLRETDPGGMEESPYDYLIYGEAELISQDLSVDNLAWLGHEIESGDVMCDFTMPPELTEKAREAQDIVEARPLNKLPDWLDLH
jgi:hypothetical protein